MYVKMWQQQETKNSNKNDGVASLKKKKKPTKSVKPVSQPAGVKHLLSLLAHF